MNWNPDQLPTLEGKTFAITGGNSGIGLEAVKILMSKGARVIFTARSEAKARGAQAKVLAEYPDAQLEYVLLDLSDKVSTEAGAKEIQDRTDRLDAVINNAGVMQTPERRTGEGFELQLATNHLGHFRLNRILMPQIEAAKGRVVPVSSVAHKLGNIQLDDLMYERDYNSTQVYAQSKLANLMYSFELQRRLQSRGSEVKSIAAHPGYSATNLQSAGVGMSGGSRMWGWIYALTNRLMAQGADRGAWPLVLAAADPHAKAGGYYGPTQMADTRGRVGESSVHDKAKDERVAKALWEKSEALVGEFFAAST